MHIFMSAGFYFSFRTAKGKILCANLLSCILSQKCPKTHTHTDRRPGSEAALDIAVHSQVSSIEES